MPTGLLEHRQYLLATQLVKAASLGLIAVGALSVSHSVRAEFKRQVVGVYFFVRRKYHGALDDVAKLTDVPRPRVIHQLLHRFVTQSHAFGAAHLREEVLGERGDVFRSLAKCREFDGEIVYAKQQIASELSGDNILAQVSISR